MHGYQCQDWSSIADPPGPFVRILQANAGLPDQSTPKSEQTPIASPVIAEPARLQRAECPVGAFQRPGNVAFPVGK